MTEFINTSALEITSLATCGGYDGAGASIIPTAMTQPFPPLPYTILPNPLTGLRRYNPGKIFGIKDARRRVLEHFRHKNQLIYEPVYLTASCNFRISSECACHIVKR